MKNSIFAIACFCASAAQAGWQDCTDAGFVRTWLGSLAESIGNSNANVPKRVRDIVEASNRRDVLQ